jgi:uncharacterized ParB-like nuclease family protein
MNIAIKRWLQDRPKWQLTLALACAVGLLGWVSVLLSSEPAATDEALAAPGAAGNSLAPSARGPATAPPSAAPAATPLPGSAAAAQPGLAALREGLASDNSGTRIEALREARDRTQLEALPELLAFDIARDPEVAPTLIGVTAELARQAEPSERAAATHKLADWLRSESEREGSDARGNVAQLVEALSGMNTPEAVPALVDALQAQGERMPLHVQTVAVDGLARLGDASARDAVEQFRTRVAESAPASGFELELQKEAAQAAERALARLSQ